MAFKYNNNEYSDYFSDNNESKKIKYPDYVDRLSNPKINKNKNKEESIKIFDNMNKKDK